MKIIIDIPKEMYEGYRNKPPMFVDLGIDSICQAISKGIPLPKEHGRLIDADALERDTEWDDYWDGWCSYSDIQIRCAPTIIEADKGKEE